MPGADRILRCPLGHPTRTMQNSDFGRTLFKGMTEAPPSKTALRCVSTKESISYKSFVAKAELTARHLLRHGCRKGDVIGLFAPNSIDWLVVGAASFRIGLVPCGISHAINAEELRRQLVLIEAKFLFTSGGQHLETAIHSLTGTTVQVLFSVGQNNEMANGGINNKESSTVPGHDDDNENGYDETKEVIYEKGNNMSGSGKRSYYDDEKGVHRANGTGKKRENEIRNKQENGIANNHKNGIERTLENGVKIGHDGGIGIENIHKNKFEIAKWGEDATEIENECQCDDHHISCVSLESFMDRGNGSLPVLPELDELHLNPCDVAMVVLTSGTTGLQKAILLSHRNIQAQFIIASDERVMKVSDGQIVFAPFSHLGGGVMTLFALALGYTCHIMTSFQLEPYLTALSENRNETIAIVPSVALSLAKAPESINHDLASLREILCGTARLSSQVEQQLSTRFPGINVRQVGFDPIAVYGLLKGGDIVSVTLVRYGLTETTAVCTCIPRNLPPDVVCSKSGSIGVPLYNVEIKVVDIVESGMILGPRQNGELLIRSPLVMMGYKEGDGISTSGAIDEEGWLHTGDMGCYDDDGYLWFVDRIADLMKTASFQVSPSELESILLTHRDVTDAAVFAVHDGTSGDDLPAAWVVRKQGGRRVTEEELHSHVSGLVASYKRLRGGIAFVESIPRTSNGKILRRKIQQLAIACLKTRT